MLAVKLNKVMIVGANFVNKGAQSMLFITIDEIRKRFPQCDIVFLSKDTENLSDFCFTKLSYSKEAYSIALNRPWLSDACKRLVKDIIKSIIGKKTNIGHWFDLKRVLPSIDIIIDISGYNIGRKWSPEVQETYLDNIRIAHKYNIPIFLMPQSFGPFDYPDDKRYIIDDIAELFPYAEKIFAREKEGLQMLVSNFGLSNVELSSDIVLQNKGVDLKHIIRKEKEWHVPDIANNAVGIVPNMQCFRFGNKEKIINLYKRIIDVLVDQGREVYLFRHSFEDLDVCYKIFESTSDNHIKVLDNNFSCLEYDEFVKKFDFIICSRYHGIVHAYRNNVPCILLGWAVKYAELAELLNQKHYYFDITTEIDSEDVIQAVVGLCRDHMNESSVIKDKMELIQRDNCFDLLNHLKEV